MQHPPHYLIGATYRHVDTDDRPSTGFEGVALAPDHPQELKVYRLDDGTPVAAIGPVFGDADRWTVQPVELVGHDANGEPEYRPTADPMAVDRGRLPLQYPLVGLRRPTGPKGAPERRYFPIDELELVED